ncbi:MAG: hypothetical protein II401_01050 [Bacteroidales bacterium]|nr:hypothetical protein [Bacteroidales bacterium]
MIISYLKYRRRAQGKYHLHSPLVFDLYEKVLEPSMSFRAKSGNHMHFKGGDFSIPLRSSRNDEAFYEILDKNLKAFVNDNPLIFNDNDVVVIVKDIHRGKQNESDWERLVGDGKVRLSIDCWKFGMIFVMKRLKKEHYILKV